MNLESLNDTPFVIFLDIDGVLYKRDQSLDSKIEEKSRELFPNYRENDTRSFNISVCHFFDKTALENLDAIIHKIEKTRKVSIVISSAWRENRTVEDLREHFFGMHNFAKYIIDKTPEKVYYEEWKDCCNVKKHGWLGCRAIEINCWLKQHPEVVDYLVLDDSDEHLSANFKKRFHKTEYKDLLTTEKANKIIMNLI